MDKLLRDISSVLASANRFDLSNELEVIAFSITKRRALKIERLKKQIYQIKTYLTNQSANLSLEFRCKLEEDLVDLQDRLNKIRGVDYVSKPSKISPPNTITQPLVISPENET